jgi:molybdopterin synthase sulfur carrier subunit
MIRVSLPPNLRIMAKINSDVELEVEGPATQRTIRDQTTFQRRPFLRFFACQQDLSHESPDAPLPEPVATGKETYYVIGAIAGG